MTKIIRQSINNVQRQQVYIYTTTLEYFPCNGTHETNLRFMNVQNDYNDDKLFFLKVMTVKIPLV